MGKFVALGTRLGGGGGSVTLETSGGRQNPGRPEEGKRLQERGAECGMTLLPSYPLGSEPRVQRV